MTKGYTVRLDETLQKEAAEIASGLGMSFSVAVSIMVRKFVAEKGFPFPVKMEDTSEPQSTEP